MSYVKVRYLFISSYSVYMHRYTFQMGGYAKYISCTQRHYILKCFLIYSLLPVIQSPLLLFFKLPTFQQCFVYNQRQQNWCIHIQAKQSDKLHENGHQAIPLLMDIIWIESSECLDSPVQLLLLFLKPQAQVFLKYSNFIGFLKIVFPKSSPFGRDLNKARYVFWKSACDMVN